VAAGGEEKKDEGREDKKRGVNIVDTRRRSTELTNKGTAALLMAGRLKRKTMSKRAKREISDGADHIWDDTPNTYMLVKVPHIGNVKEGTPASRHRDRQSRNWPTKGRCGRCIGCSALTRCENQGAYTRTDEAIEVIKSGVLENEEEGLKEAMELLRKSTAAGAAGGGAAITAAGSGGRRTSLRRGSVMGSFKMRRGSMKKK
jgi:hypothetical protein